jgi:hypothetical protein
MVLTVSFGLSPVIGLCCHRRLRCHKLDASVEASGPHDFAVREARAFVFRAACVHRIPPRVRDDRETPLIRDGTCSLYYCFYQFEKRNIFGKRAGHEIATRARRANHLRYFARSVQTRN